MNLSSSLNVKGKRIWEIVTESDKKAIACFIPLTWPIKPYKGILISCNFTPPTSKDYTHPSELREEINSVLNKPLSMDVKNFRPMRIPQEFLEKIRDNSLHIESKT